MKWRICGLPHLQMRPLHSGTLSRRGSYWLLTTALVTIALFAVMRTLQLRKDQMQDEVRRTEQQLHMRGELWERAVLDRVGAWIVDMASATDIAARQQHHRMATPWFDAFYLWENLDTGQRCDPDW